MQVSVVIPTYNEAENIRLIVPRIACMFRDTGLRGEIIVVDDDSPDKTGVIALGLGKECPVHVDIRKEERGLATAVMKGFQLATGEVCLVMDADMSHPVDKIPEMVLPILDGRCDATVGTRYIEGGGSEKWPWIRKMISVGAGLLARGVTKLKDPTSGFMAIRRNLLDTTTLDPVGWKIVLEVIVKTGATFLEIPFVFSDRRRGKSKLNLKVQKQYLQHLIKLYSFKFPRVSQFVKFCLVGSAGVVVDTLVLVVLVEIFSFGPKFAAVFAFLAAVSFNFKFNHFWTFRSSDRNRLWKYFSFVAVCGIGLGIRILVMHLLIEFAGMGIGRWYIAASIAGILCATVFNFIGSSFVFQDPEAEDVVRFQ